MADGRLIVDAKLTRTGVFDYRNSDGSTRKEFRPASEVFDEASLATFPLASVTNDHPADMVTVDNASGVTVGMVTGNIRRLDDHVAAELIIFDGRAIEAIEAGKLELSCGYHAEVDETSGTTPDGEHFDCSQKNIRINHVAIVDVGRAGPEARIRMDAAEPFPKPTQASTQMDITEALQKIATLEVEKATQAARADRAEAAVVVAGERADKAEADRDVALDTVKAETARADKADSSINERVNALVKLRADAAAILPKDEDAARFDTMSDREIKAAVIKTVTGFEITDDHSDVYLDGRFDGAVAQASKAGDALAGVRVAADLGRTDSTDRNSEAKAREDMIKRNADAWKGSRN